MIGTLKPFKPHAWQIAPWRDKSATLLLTGSAGGGKSRLAAEKIHAACLKYPGTMALAVRKIRQSMVNSTVLFLERAIIGKDPHVKHVAQAHRFEYDNGSILAYGGMMDEEQREAIRSIGQDGGVDIVWMEEAIQFTEDDYNELTARARGRAMGWRQIILTTNPGPPSHFIKRRLIDGGEAATYYSKAEDNPANPDDYVTTLDRMTGVLKKRLRLGQWVQAEGAVYDLWDDALHLIDPFVIPATWRRFRVIDFGFTNPFVCQWWAQDADGRLYLYRQLYMTGRTVHVHKRDINRLSAGENIEATICDTDAEDRATLEETTAEEWGEGIATKAAKKDVRPGIDAVTERLKLDGTGKPRLFMMRGSLVETDHGLEEKRKPLCTEDEVASYVWEVVKDGKPVKEEPHKVDDHGMDGMRYCVMYVDNGEPEGSFVMKARRTY
jgi:PBSX family phage terminase large subunit